MGRVYTRGEFYYVDVNRNGRRVRRKIGKSKKLAQIVLKDMEVQIERKQWGFAQQEGVIETIIESFLNNAELHVRVSTKRRYSRIIENFQEFLKLKFPTIKKVGELNLSVIQEYKFHRAGGRILSRKHTSVGPITKNSKLHPKTLNLELKTGLILAVA